MDARPDARPNPSEREAAVADFEAAPVDTPTAVEVAVRVVAFFAVAAAVPAAALRAVADTPRDGAEVERAVAAAVADARAVFADVAAVLAIPEQLAVTLTCLTATADAEPRARLMPVAGAEGFDAATVGGIGRLRQATREGVL